MKKRKSIFEKHDLFKIAIICILATLLLTWIIPYGGFSSGEFIKEGYGRTGIVDAILSSVYSANFFLQQLLFVLFIGVFYGIISKTSGYKSMVSKISKKLNGKEKLFVVFTSLVITLLTSFVTQTFVVLIFVPLVISICDKLKLDKLSAFAITFGSMVIGTLGATFGTEGLIYFINYLSNYAEVTITTEIGIRFGVLSLAYIVFNFFIIKHLNKSLKKSDEDKIRDVFEVEEEKNKNVKFWPMALFFIITFLCVILGYINWNGNFNITIFDSFHEWLTELHIGDFNIISYILGKNATAFGAWELYTISVILFIILIVAKFIYNIKFDEILENAMVGVKALIKPIILVLCAYIVFVLVYWAPFTATITNWILSLSDKFSPYLTALAAGVASLFHTDFGYTGYAIGGILANSDSFNIGFLIYTTINGLIQLIAPTSVMLLFGLSYLNIPYKKWIKYIWKFVLIMLAVLLIVFTLLTYL